MRIVLDNRSLVQYTLAGGSVMQRIMIAWRAGEFSLLSSPQTRKELALMLAHPDLQARSSIPMAALADSLDRFSIYVPGHLDLGGVCRNPQNNNYLACAVEGQAQYIVSADRDLLALGQYRNVCVLSPSQFLVAHHLAQLALEAIRAQYSPESLKGILSDLHLESCTRDKLIEAVAFLSNP